MYAQSLRGYHDALISTACLVHCPQLLPPASNPCCRMHRLDRLDFGISLTVPATHRLFLMVQNDPDGVPVSSIFGATANTMSSTAHAGNFRHN